MGRQIAQMISEDKTHSLTTYRDSPQESFLTGLLQWPRSVSFFGILLGILYAPVLWETSRVWFTNETYAHGVFIIPLSILTLWLQRNEIAAASRQPRSIGIVALGIGLLMLVAARLLSLKYIALWSLLPVLYGLIQVLHGAELWKIARFAVLFLVLAGPIPISIMQTVMRWIQNASTIGAFGLMEGLGFSISRQGNLLDVPGATLEVADVCSGFRKTLSLCTFALIYGYMFPISMGRRLALLILSFPIALFANIVRIGGLITVTTYGGTKALDIAHDWAEILVLVIAFLLFVCTGKLLGCKKIRFSL